MPFVPSRTINKPQVRRDPTHQMAQTEAEHEGQNNQAECHFKEHGLVLRTHRPVDSQRIVFGVSPDSGRPTSARVVSAPADTFPCTLYQRLIDTQAMNIVMNRPKIAPIVSHSIARSGGHSCA